MEVILYDLVREPYSLERRKSLMDQHTKIVMVKVKTTEKNFTHKPRGTENVAWASYPRLWFIKNTNFS